MLREPMAPAGSGGSQGAVLWEARGITGKADATSQRLPAEISPSAEGALKPICN